MGKGYERLWNWFGLSYASFLVLPRVMMHDMPDDWQDRMATLLKEWDKHWKDHPVEQYQITAVHRGRFVRLARWLRDYRHPSEMDLQRFRN